MEQKKLYRIEEGKKVSGVCGGIGEYFGVDTTVIRLIWALGTLFTACFGGILAYIICSVIIPTKSDVNKNNVE